MEFRILGTLQVCDGGRDLPIPGKQRALLAILLLQPNRPVSEDLLIEALWGDRATARAADNLHVLVSRLRGTLGRERLVREGSGYLVRVDDGELDAESFERLRAESKPREALEVWRGDPLADFTYESWAQNEIRRLEELRLATLEERIERDLAAGADAELVGELQALVAEHPLREALRRHLIVALYRSERQAEALDAYRDARRMLDEELGLEPSPALRELEGAVLRHDPVLDRPRAARFAPAPALRRRPVAAVAVAAAALTGGFATAYGAIQMLERGEGEGRLAAAATRTQAQERPKMAARTTSTTRVVVIRERIQPAPPPEAQPTARPPAPPPPTVAPPPPALPPPPPSRPPQKAKPKPKLKLKPKPVTPQPAPEPAPAPPAFRLTDNFDDGVLDQRTWHRGTSTGAAAEERNGRLEMSFSAGAVADGGYSLISATYGTHCRFLGDFDARVEFELLDWPQANGMVIQLSAWFQSVNAGVIRQSRGWGEEYGSWLGPSSQHRTTPSNDLRGALRLQRVGNVITTYYRRSGDWYPVGRASGFVGAPLIGLQAMSKDEWFADKPVRIAFDNFSLTAAQKAC